MARDDYYKLCEWFGCRPPSKYIFWFHHYWQCLKTLLEAIAFVTKPSLKSKWYIKRLWPLSWLPVNEATESQKMKLTLVCKNYQWCLDSSCWMAVVVRCGIIYISPLTSKTAPWTRLLWSMPANTHDSVTTTADLFIYATTSHSSLLAIETHHSVTDLRTPLHTNTLASKQTNNLQASKQINNKQEYVTYTKK